MIDIQSRENSWRDIWSLFASSTPMIISYQVSRKKGQNLFQYLWECRVGDDMSPMYINVDRQLRPTLVVQTYASMRNPSRVRYQQMPVEKSNHHNKISVEVLGLVTKSSSHMSHPKKSWKNQRPDYPHWQHSKSPNLKDCNRHVMVRMNLNWERCGI